MKGDIDEMGQRDDGLVMVCTGCGFVYPRYSGHWCSSCPLDIPGSDL